MTNNPKKAVILLSGGLDSATVLAMAKADGYTPYALSFSYGQRHTIELDMAKQQAARQGVAAHTIIDINPHVFAGSALTSNIDVPKHNTVADIGSDIPVTYVPARNTLFLSYALAYAESIGAFDIFLGVNAVDYSGYPDCRPEFVQAYQHMANLALAATADSTHQLTIHAPLMDWDKTNIIQHGTDLGVDYATTNSCYDPVGHLACGHCDSCLLRLNGFANAGLQDPHPYVQPLDKKHH